MSSELGFSEMTPKNVLWDQLLAKEEKELVATMSSEPGYLEFDQRSIKS